MTARPNILVYGLPNTGKTYSLKSLDTSPEYAKGVLYLNLDSKHLPWFGGNSFSRYTVPCPTLLPQLITNASKQVDDKGKLRFHTIVVDTVTRFLDTYVSKFVTTKEPKYFVRPDGTIGSDMNYVMTTKTGQIDSLSAWGRMSSLFKDTMEAADASPCQVIFISHMSQVQRPDGSYVYDAPIQGQVGKVGLLSWFSIAVVATTIPMDVVLAEPDSELLSKVPSVEGVDDKYVFQIAKTTSTQEYPIRTITGMFSPTQKYIDNDFNKLFTHLDALYAVTPVENF